MRRDRKVDAERIGPVDGEAFERTNTGVDDGRQKTLVELQLRDPGDVDVPLPPLAVLERQRFHRPDALKRLKEKSPSLTFGAQDGAGPLAIVRQHHHEPADNQSAEQEHDKRQQGAEEEHHRQEDKKSQRIEHRAEQLSGEEGAYPPDLIHIAADDADLRALEVVDRKLEDVVHQVFREPDIDPRGDEEDEVRAQVGEDRLEDDHYAHRDAKHCEGVEASVVDHLVRQKAPKDDRGEREKAKRCRAYRKVPDNPALSKNQPHDHAKAEGLLLISKVVDAAKKHNLSRPRILKALAVNDELGVFPRFRIQEDYRERIVTALEPLENHARTA